MEQNMENERANTEAGMGAKAEGEGTAEGTAGATSAHTPAPTPAATIESHIQTPPAPEHRYAGFWIRFVASLLDGIVIDAFHLLVLVIAGVDIMEPPALLKLLLMILSIVYYVTMTVLLGQTLGKMAVGIRVIQRDGGPNSWGWILLRETIGKFVSALLLMIGFIMAGFDKKKRALHDHMSRTLVVKA